jgi:hypothetical protein
LLDKLENWYIATSETGVFDMKKLLTITYMSLVSTAILTALAAGAVAQFKQGEQVATMAGFGAASGPTSQPSEVPFPQHAIISDCQSHDTSSTTQECISLLYASRDMAFVLWTRLNPVVQQDCVRNSPTYFTLASCAMAAVTKDSRVN